MAEQSRLIAGAMSGTSADGVDVAIVRVGGVGLNMTADLLLHQHRPYEVSLKSAIFALRGEQKTSLAELARVGREISLAYAACVNDALAAAKLTSADLAAIAAHGQTLFHQPPDTIQWLDPALLAAETGCAVVSDFRRADCAAGGQGAPLVPFADYVLLQDRGRSRVLLNIGGIANVTYVPPYEALDRVVAFDTGAGNCICDWLCRTHDPNGPGYDKDGRIAATGDGNFKSLYYEVLEHPFFKAKPPKSTDVPSMIEAWTAGVSRAMQKTPDYAKGSFGNLLKAATEVTGISIVEAIRRFLQRMPDEIIISGGGALNPQIVGSLRYWLKFHQLKAQIISIEALGIPVDAKEAIAFALLGAATLDNFPSNIPSCTGARRAVVLGSITPKPYNQAR